MFNPDNIVIGTGDARQINPIVDINDGIIASLHRIFE